MSLQHTTRFTAPSKAVFRLRRRAIPLRCRTRCHAEHGVTHCAYCENGAVSRRKAMHAALLAGIVICAPKCAQAASRDDSERRGLARYIKKKPLDPLDTYVPAVVAARYQLNRAGSVMKEDLQSARQLLRTGPFDGLRDNVKALGEYAEQKGVKDSKKLVDDFFLKVSDYDFTLFQAKRYSQPVKEDSEIALGKTLEALERLLATVPQDVLDDSERIVKAVEDSVNAQPAAPKEERDQQLDQLVQLVPG